MNISIHHEDQHPRKIYREYEEDPLIGSSHLLQFRSPITKQKIRCRGVSEYERLPSRSDARALAARQAAADMHVAN